MFEKGRVGPSLLVLMLMAETIVTLDAKGCGYLEGAGSMRESSEQALLRNPCWHETARVVQAGNTPLSAVSPETVGSHRGNIHWREMILVRDRE